MLQEVIMILMTQIIHQLLLQLEVKEFMLRMLEVSNSIYLSFMLSFLLATGATQRALKGVYKNIMPKQFFHSAKNRFLIMSASRKQRPQMESDEMAEIVYN